MLRILALCGLAALTFIVQELSTGGSMPLRPDTSRAALASLGQEYGDLQLWVSAIAATTDTLQPESSESARAMADQLARLMGPLEQDFEQTTAALSTSQLELVLPLWERMAFAHAGFAMLRDEVAALGGNPALNPAELHDLASQLSVVLDFAGEIHRIVMEELSAPVPTSIRVILGVSFPGLNSGKYAPYPSCSSRSTGMNRSAAEFMQ